MPILIIFYYIVLLLVQLRRHPYLFCSCSTISFRWQVRVRDHFYSKLMYRQFARTSGKTNKLRYSLVTDRRVVSVDILPIATQQCRNYLYEKSWRNRSYEVAGLQWVDVVEYRGDLWHQKTRLPELSCDFLSVVIRLAVLVELRLVTDRHRPMASTAHA